MKPRLWQTLALLYGAFLVAFIALDCATALFANTDQGFRGEPLRGSPGTMVVKKITNASAFDQPVAVGDRVRLEDSSLATRMRYSQQRLGDRFVFVGTSHDGRPMRFVNTVVATTTVPPQFWPYELIATAFAVVGLIIVIRRPNEPIARTLVWLLFTLGTLFISNVAWLPDWTVLPVLTVHLAAQVLCAYAGLALATTFPQPSARGLRAWMRRLNLPFAIVCLATVGVSVTMALGFLRSPPAWLTQSGIVMTIAYFASITLAFIIANREARGADAKRAQWVAWTLALGFSGALVGTVQYIFRVPLAEWEQWLPVTLIAIPLGLGYAIVRHRVVDIGFVVNRALVFGTLSAIVVVAFMVLEWALSSAAVRMSHITSTSVELALALVLGFSMRSIHARVDRVVDDLFFRDRHEAERALRTLARETAFVTEPQVAVARVHAELLVRTDAAYAGVYVADGPLALRIDPSQSALPDAVDIDDPALVRMRATRAPCSLHRLPSALGADHAFPLLVRDAVTGFIALGPKTNGEAFAPDEIATIEMVALALGNALDALQTAALKREIARVLVDGAPLDALRRTVDPALWVRGSLAQPAGSLPGLSE